MNNNESQVSFFGGVDTVTGANFMLDTGNEKILIDCGMIQGVPSQEKLNWESFLYNPSDISSLFVTHSHLDHIGRILKLVAEGFSGTIYSTPPTKDIAKVMMEDSMRVINYDKKNTNIKNWFNNKVLEKTLSLWKTVEYHKNIKLRGGVVVSFLNSGHILGSAMINFKRNDKTILFTGDIGNSPSPILPDIENISDIDYLIMESVYGDRVNEEKMVRRVLLEKIINENYKRGGVLIIPIFSLERTQEFLFELNSLVGSGDIHSQPIFLDSPLAIKVTDIYKKYNKYFNRSAQNILSKDSDIFDFPGLKETIYTEESKNILHFQNPKIILAGSGMSSGGRILHHEVQYLSNPNNTILITGYQALGTLGREIEEGSKKVRIFHKDIIVRAHISTIKGYSGHADSNQLINFVENISNTVKKVFVVMGEPKSSLFLVQRLRDYLGVNAMSPNNNDSFKIEF